MYSIYEKQKNDHLKLYFKNKAQEEETEEEEADPFQGRMKSKSPKPGPKNRSSDKSGLFASIGNRTNTSPGRPRLFNVYENAASHATQKSLERKDKEFRMTRSKNITQQLSLLKGRRLLEEENRPPNKSPSPTPHPKWSPNRPTPGSSKSPPSKQPPLSTRDTVGSRASARQSPGLASSLAQPGKPPSPRPTQSRLFDSRDPRPQPAPRPKAQPSASPQDSGRSFKKRESIKSKESSKSRSNRSDARSTSSKQSGTQSRGLSLNRDGSIEKKLDNYVKNRKVASTTAIRLNINLLLNLDSILWNICTCHHVADL